MIILRFNDERSVIDFWRTRFIPTAAARRSTAITGVPTGVHPEHILKTLETTVDCIVDFRIDEERGEVRNLMRIRSMRNLGYDTRWLPLKTDENFEVTLEK